MMLCKKVVHHTPHVKQTEINPTQSTGDEGVGFYKKKGHVLAENGSTSRKKVVSGFLGPSPTRPKCQKKCFYRCLNLRPRPMPGRSVKAFGLSQGFEGPSPPPNYLAFPLPSALSKKPYPRNSPLPRFHGPLWWTMGQSPHFVDFVSDFVMREKLEVVKRIL